MVPSRSAGKSPDLIRERTLPGEHDHRSATSAIRRQAGSVIAVNRQSDGIALSRRPSMLREPSGCETSAFCEPETRRRIPRFSFSFIPGPRGCSGCKAGEWRSQAGTESDVTTMGTMGQPMVSKMGTRKVCIAPERRSQRRRAMTVLGTMRVNSRESTHNHSGPARVVGVILGLAPGAN